MSGDDDGSNVRRLSYLDQTSDWTIRISQEPDSRWAVRADSSFITQALLEIAETAELASGMMIERLAGLGVNVPEPPDDFGKRFLRIDQAPRGTK